MHQYNVGAPAERITLDMLGPLPTTESGNKYVLLVADYFTYQVARSIFADGIVERMNGTVEAQLSKFVDEHQHNWEVSEKPGPLRFTLSLTVWWKG